MTNVLTQERVSGKIEAQVFVSLTKQHSNLQLIFQKTYNNITVFNW